MLQIIKEMIKTNFTHTIFAKRKAGKTILMVILLYVFKGVYDKIIIISSTIKEQDIYEEMGDMFDLMDVTFIDHTEIISNMKNELKRKKSNKEKTFMNVNDVDLNTVIGYIFNNIKDTQKSIKQYNLNPENKQKVTPYKYHIILDDVLSNDASIMKRIANSYLSAIYTEGRHQKISLTFIIQSMRYFSPSFVENTDYFSFFRIGKTKTKEYVTELLNFYNTKKEFYDKYNKIFKGKRDVMTINVDDEKVYGNFKEVK